jgi:3-deoxy-manno-octulosonate cytidylyltransferase (CMP-KDO synthetase)
VGTVAVRCSAETFRHLAEDAAQGRVGGTTVVVNARSEALYFSKRILPYLPEGRLPADEMPVLLHLGLYAYRRAALERYVATGPTMLENVEGLEQLRFLVAGVPVAVVALEEQGYPIVEVNNPSDVPLVEHILNMRALS